MDSLRDGHGAGGGLCQGNAALLLEATLSLEGRSGMGGRRERFPRPPCPSGVTTPASGGGRSPHREGG